MIRIYSDVLDKYFDTVKEAQAAEKAAAVAKDKEAAEKECATKRVEDAYLNWKTVTERSYKEVTDCYAECKEAVDAYSKKYGPVTVYINDEDKVVIEEGERDLVAEAVESFLDFLMK